MRDLELVEPLNFRAGLGDEVRPGDLGEVAVRLVGRFEPREAMNVVRAVGDAL